MTNNIVELLNLVLDGINPINTTYEVWRLRISSIKRFLNNAKNVIETSQDPLADAFSVLHCAAVFTRCGLAETLGPPDLPSYASSVRTASPDAQAFEAYKYCIDSYSKAMVAMHSSRSNSQDSPQSVQSTGSLQNNQSTNVEKHDSMFTAGPVNSTSCETNRDSIHSLGSADNGHVGMEEEEHVHPLDNRDYYDDYAYQYYNTHFVKNRDVALPQGLFSELPFVSDTTMDLVNDPTCAYVSSADFGMESEDLLHVDSDVYSTDINRSEGGKVYGKALDTCTPQNGFDGSSGLVDGATESADRTGDSEEHDTNKLQTRHVSIDVTDSPLELQDNNKIPSVYDLYSLDPRVCSPPLVSIGFRSNVAEGASTDQEAQHTIPSIDSSHQDSTPSKYLLDECADGSRMEDGGKEKTLEPLQSPGSSSERQSTKHVHFSDEVVRIGESTDGTGPASQESATGGNLASSLRKTTSSDGYTQPSSYFDGQNGVRSLIARSFGFKRGPRKQKPGFQSKRGHLQPITSSSPDSFGSPSSLVFSSPEKEANATPSTLPDNTLGSPENLHYGRHNDHYRDHYGQYGRASEDHPSSQDVHESIPSGGTPMESIEGETRELPTEVTQENVRDGQYPQESREEETSGATVESTVVQETSRPTSPQTTEDDDHSVDRENDHSVDRENGQVDRENGQVDREDAPVEPSDLPSLLDFFPTIESNYKTLASITSNMEGIDLYVVVAEMMMNKVNYLNDINSFIINYRVIDPSVLGTCTEFSIQVFSPVNGKGYHIGFGDILRLKRVNAIVRTFRDKKYVNITINTKKNSSIRMWMHKVPSSSTESSMETTVTSSDAPPTETSTSNKIQELQQEAIIVRAGGKTLVSEVDVMIIEKLRIWVDTLKPLEIISKSEFRKNLMDAEERQPLDFIVYILKVVGNSELLVCDSESKAIIKVTSEVLLLNAFKSENPIGQGNWIKLRSFVKKGDFIVNMEHSSITRLPSLDIPLFKERADVVPRLSKKRRSVQINEWNNTSLLNGHFPRKIIRHNGYVKKMLQFSNHDGNFETVSKPHDRDQSSQEEGEICA